MIRQLSVSIFLILAVSAICLSIQDTVQQVTLHEGQKNDIILKDKSPKPLMIAKISSPEKGAILKIHGTKGIDLANALSVSGRPYTIELEPVIADLRDPAPAKDKRKPRGASIIRPDEEKPYILCDLPDGTKAEADFISAQSALMSDPGAFDTMCYKHYSIGGGNYRYFPDPTHPGSCDTVRDILSSPEDLPCIHSCAKAYLSVHCSLAPDASLQERASHGDEVRKLCFTFAIREIGDSLECVGIMPEDENCEYGCRYSDERAPWRKDEDYDRMSDTWEEEFGLDPKNDDASEDSDGDGLTNYEEYLGFTDPGDPDTDKDGIFDGYEAIHGLDPLDPSDNESDNDNDLLTAVEEFLSGTDPNSDDTDGDEMPDGWESRTGLDPLAKDADEDPDGDGLANIEEFNDGIDPNKKDSDEDGLEDPFELNIGTDPMIYDSDNDGLSDSDEITGGTEPLYWDTDNDGISDLDEFQSGTNPSSGDDKIKRPEITLEVTGYYTPLESDFEYWSCIEAGIEVTGRAWSRCKEIWKNGKGNDFCTFWTNRKQFAEAVKCNGDGVGTEIIGGFQRYTYPDEKIRPYKKDSLRSVSDPKTASGTVPMQKHTLAIAKDKNNPVLSMGDKVYITFPEGCSHLDGIYKVEDRGGGLDPDQIDAYTGIGKQSFKVWEHCYSNRLPVRLI